MNRTADEALLLEGMGLRLIVGNGGGASSVATQSGREKLLLARRDHSVATINVVIDREACGYGRNFLSDMDTIMVLETMATFLSRGTLRNTKTKESWSWSLANILDAVPTIRSSFFTVVFHRTSVIVHSLVCYFLVSSITALVIRVVTSSGVVVMFPLFLGLQKVLAMLSEVANIDLGEIFPAMRDQSSTLTLLALAYPWIGSRIHATRAQGRSIAPLIVGHLIYLVSFLKARRQDVLVLRTSRCTSALT